MKRLNLTVEGQTEQEFAVAVLQPHLAGFQVFVGKPRLTGPHGRRGGRIPRGGFLGSFQHALEDIRRWLRQDRSADARFSTMIDLYSLPNNFPGHADAAQLRDPYERIGRLEDALAAELGDPRFIPYLQLHEFESLVLADPTAFGEIYEARGTAVAALVEECSVFAPPELIDDSVQTHPKARIQKHFPDYEPNVAGPLLTQHLGLTFLRQRCTHFNAWLTRLEQLDASPG